MMRLRAAMTQARLNAVALCPVHREWVVQVDVDCVAAAFVQLNPHRETVWVAQNSSVIRMGDKRLSFGVA